MSYFTCYTSNCRECWNSRVDLVNQCSSFLLIIIKTVASVELHVLGGVHRRQGRLSEIGCGSQEHQGKCQDRRRFQGFCKSNV